MKENTVNVWIISLVVEEFKTETFANLACSGILRAILLWRFVEKMPL